jgi:ATP-dependent Lon protease
MQDAASTSEPFVLPNKLPLIILSDCYHFPGCYLPLRIFEERYRRMLDYALETDRVFGVGVRLESGGVFPYVTAGLVKTSVLAEDGTSQVMLHGLSRMRIRGVIQKSPFPMAEVEPLEVTPCSPERFERWRTALSDLLELRSPGEEHLMSLISAWVRRSEDASAICDVIGFHLLKDPEVLQSLLAEVDTEQRMDLVFESVRKGF